MRTRLHILGERAGIEPARPERTLHILFEAAHRDGLGVSHPRRAPRLGVLQLEDRDEGVRLHRREAAGAVGLAERRADPTRSREAQQRLHSRGYRSQGCSNLAAFAREWLGMSPRKTPAHIRQQPLLDPQRAQEPRVELERVDGLEIVDERRELVGWDSEAYQRRIQPEGLVLGRRDAAQELRLRPRKAAGDESGLDCG